VAPEILKQITMSTADTAVLIVAHGSRDEAARAEFLEQVRGISLELQGTTVGHAVLEFPGFDSPSIQAAVDALAQKSRRLIVLPLFLFDAGHVRRDIPAELAAARSRNPQLVITVLPQVSPDDGLIEVLVDRVRCARGTVSALADDPWAILLVGAGTSSPDANAELTRMAEKLSDTLFTVVEPAFVSLARPTVEEGVARCVDRGARHVVTGHYFLNTGVLARRIEPKARAEAERLGVKLTIGEHFGTHQILAKALASRIYAALMGQADVSNHEDAENDEEQSDDITKT
jgi:sirohydrochlorin cobaltochelatase